MKGFKWPLKSKCPKVRNMMLILMVMNLIPEKVKTLESKSNKVSPEYKSDAESDDLNKKDYQQLKLSIWQL